MENGFMAEALSTQQRQLCTIGEVSLPAENSMGYVEVASPGQPPSDESGKGVRCDSARGEPQREDTLHSSIMEVPTKEGRGEEEKKDAAMRTTEASGCDEPDLAIPARERAILNRVLGHWKRRAGREEAAPSENLARITLIRFTPITLAAYVRTYVRTPSFDNLWSQCYRCAFGLCKLSRATDEEGPYARTNHLCL